MRIKSIGLASIGIGILAVIGLAIVGPTPEEPKPHLNQAGNSHELVVYKSATCGCCGIWTTYMKNLGYKVDVVNTEELDTVKEEHQVPQSLNSCHTTIVNSGQYFIEGHIPEEAISQLLEDEPPILGIGMPGMPSASPGMPGKKLAPFDISQVSKDGQVSPYMSI